MDTCRICGHHGSFKHYSIREMMNGTGEEFQYFECAECHCCQIAEIPDNLGDYYAADYYSYSHVKGEKQRNRIMRKRKLPIFWMWDADPENGFAIWPQMDGVIFMAAIRL